MKECRIDARKLVDTRVRLYHQSLGRLEGVMKDISESGVALILNTAKIPQESELSASSLFLRPINLDVLFPVSYLRQSESELIFKFLE